jgi:hypothetical protein
MPRDGFSGLPGETSSQTRRAERRQRPLRHVPVPGVGRVEAAAEQADPGPAPVASRAGGFRRHLTWTLTVTGCGASPS